MYKVYVAAYPKKSKLVFQQDVNVRRTELQKEEGLEDKVAAFEKCRTEKRGIAADFLVKTNTCSTLKTILCQTFVLFAPLLKVQLVTMSKLRLTTHH